MPPSAACSTERVSQNGIRQRTRRRETPESPRLTGVGFECIVSSSFSQHWGYADTILDLVRGVNEDKRRVARGGHNGPHVAYTDALPV